QIELVSRRQSEDLLDRAIHVDDRVERAVDGVMPRVWTDDQSDGAMTVYMIEAVLRIVLRHENRRLLPVPALRDRFNDAAEGEIVVGDRGARRRKARARPLCVIVVEKNEDQVGKVAVP